MSPTKNITLINPVRLHAVVRTCSMVIATSPISWKEYLR